MQRTPSPVMRRRRLGVELRRLRMAAGLTGDQVVERVGWAAKSKLSRLENGRSRPDLADILDLLDLYQVGGEGREELVAIAREAGNTRWLRAYAVMTARQRGYAELEGGATHIREYAAATVPGLLQSPQYARVRIMSSRPLQALLTSQRGLPTQSPDGERMDPQAEVDARMARQSILTRDVDPPAYEAVLDEAALIGRSAPPNVLSGQLNHLRAVASLPNVTLRVLLREARVGEFYQPQHGFSIYTFADPGDLQTIAVEALSSDLILTDRTAASRYVKVYEWLRAAALTPEATVDWLAGHVNATR
jgi:transcriptional regulator with XRE-family HTH domain